MKLNIRTEAPFEKPEYDDGGNEIGSQELVYALPSTRFNISNEDELTQALEDSVKLNREFGLLNLMNAPEHCSAPFHSVSSKVAKSTKMAAAHIQTYVLHVTWSILYTYLITPPEPVRRHGESKCFELGEF